MSNTSIKAEFVVPIIIGLGITTLVSFMLWASYITYTDMKKPHPSFTIHISGITLDGQLSVTKNLIIVETDQGRFTFPPTTPFCAKKP